MAAPQPLNSAECHSGPSRPRKLLTSRYHSCGDPGPSLEDTKSLGVRLEWTHGGGARSLRTPHPAFFLCWPLPVTIQGTECSGNVPSHLRKHHLGNSASPVEYSGCLHLLTSETPEPLLAVCGWKEKGSPWRPSHTFMVVSARASGSHGSEQPGTSGSLTTEDAKQT